MDVQTLGQVPTLGSLGDASTGAPQAAPAPVAGSVPDDPAAPPSQKSGLPAFALPQDVARIFTGGAASHVTVSFQVAHSPNEIVTVFKNSQTGEEITQVPSEIMVQIAEFFDQVAGVVLDKSA